MKLNKWISIILVGAVLLLTACGGAANQGGAENKEVPTSHPAIEEESSVAAAVSETESGIQGISKYGNIILEIAPDEFRALGFETADVINARIGKETFSMPVGTAYSDVDNGQPICCVRTNNEGIEQVVLAINGGNLASGAGIADIQTIDADPGFEVIWKDGYDASMKVHLSMKEKQGYAEEYKLQQLTGARSDKREDYPNLSDAEYANIREVNTTGMGKGALYRSSSPIDPSLNRNTHVDALIPVYNIHTIMNMTDQESTMKSYPGFDETNYAKCDVIALAMGMDYSAEDFRQKLADGLRFMIDHEGPYLLHCKEGKDRTGFVAAILEALMGANMDEITADYMTTYTNYYGILPGSPQYDEIAKSNIGVSMEKALGMNQSDAQESDLPTIATNYLKGIGLSDDEISTLKEKLGKNYVE